MDFWVVKIFVYIFLEEFRSHVNIKAYLCCNNYGYGWWRWPEDACSLEPHNRDVIMDEWKYMSHITRQVLSSNLRNKSGVRFSCDFPGTIKIFEFLRVHYTKPLVKTKFLEK